MTATRTALAPELEIAVECVTAADLSPVPPFAVENEREIGCDRIYLATRMLWDERRFVFVSMLRGTLGFLLLAFLLPSRYESKTELMPPDSSSDAMGTLATLTSSGGSAGGMLGSAVDLLGVHTSGALFITILSSQTVEDRIIDRFDLRRVYWTKTYATARERLEAHTGISEEKKSGVLTIAIRDHDPQRSAAMAGAYVEELNRMLADLNTSAAHRERMFLEERLQVVKGDLDRSAKDFSEFSSQNAAIDIKEQGRAMVTAAATLQGQVIAQESELRGLEQIYTPNNVRVRSVSARLSELRQQLRILGGSASPPARDPDDGESAYPSLRQLPVLGLTYADLYRHLTINESVYEVLTKQYELARVQEAKEIPRVKVIDPGRVPEKRSGPPRLEIIAAGAMLSFCGAGAWLFARDAWQHTDAQNPRKALAGEIVSSVADCLPWRRSRANSLGLGPRRHREGLRYQRNHGGDLTHSESNARDFRPSE